MDLSTSWKRAQISEIAGFQPPVYWPSLAVGLLTHWLQPHVGFFSFQGKCLRMWMKTDCRTAPHQVKPCLPWLLLCLKAGFVPEFSPWSLLCSKGGFCRFWLSTAQGRCEVLVQGTDSLTPDLPSEFAHLCSCSYCPARQNFSDEIFNLLVGLLK